MFFRDNRLTIITALFSGLVFLTLMGVQNNWFSSSPRHGILQAGLPFERETWMDSDIRFPKERIVLKPRFLIHLRFRRKYSD